MSATLKIIDADGKNWEVKLLPGKIYNIGRAKDNDIVLNDRRASRHHAHVVADQSNFKIIDGYNVSGEIFRSVNRVFVNNVAQFEKTLEENDQILIGESILIFHKIFEPTTLSSAKNKASGINYGADAPATGGVIYADQPLGHTQLQISASDIIGHRASLSVENDIASPEEIKELRRKAKALDLLYEMSKTLGTVFDLKEIFAKATDLIFRGTPAERVVALLADESNGSDENFDYDLLPIAARARDPRFENLTERLTISRTITQKVMRERVALLSQDAKTDAQFSGAESIVMHGVRSTICAPLITESGVHGVMYADRLDPFAKFSSDDLELIGAVAAQTAMVVETVKAHERLAREEVARANYKRFMPEYVVKQLLENPDSFKLGGVNQKVTILFADIRGFTALSERENPEKIVSLLNRYFSAMSEEIFAHEGTLDKYIGDGLMAIFGAPTATSSDAKNAVRTAVAMQRRVAQLNQQLIIEGFNQVNVGIGLHTGVATVGYIGSNQRSEYTAIGDTVNLASRLESNARGGEILVSDQTAFEVGNLFDYVPRESLTVKNRVQPVALFEVKWN